ncbi:MAG: hypothetical protein GKR89_00150 [Candidatus Latescibacteria bacterium]|nr:hypothetical protein [Candidatus Latescibacterota bacterium]
MAVIICDMWDDHHCVSAAKRVVEMAPRMNEVVGQLRDRGALVIHAPSDCMRFYEDTPQRRRAQEAPDAGAGVEFDWRPWNGEREAPLPPGIGDPGCCSCHAAEPCCGPNEQPWVRQIEALEVAEEDAVSDRGNEVYNLLAQRGIEQVLMMGVHTNVCVLGRPFGIRQLVYAGKKPLLCRDLTDAFHRQEGGQFRGTRLVVEHIERHWCPTVTSDQLVEGQAFRFKGDRDDDS